MSALGPVLAGRAVLTADSWQAPQFLARLLESVGCAEAGVACSDDGLPAIGHLQLGEDSGYVVANGLQRQHEALSDGGVVVALADQCALRRSTA